MINSYATIDKLFGTPLSAVPQPNVPFKLKGWHVAAGIAVGVFTAYGVYCAYRDARKYLRDY
jgi:hypothetical protein